MDYDTYSQSKQFEYAALAQTVASILKAALAGELGGRELIAARLAAEQMPTKRRSI
jgi:hypothetical protein